MSKAKALDKNALENAKAAYASGDYGKVIDILNAARVDEDEYMDFAYILGLAYAKKKRFDEALIYLEQIVTQDTNGERARQCRFILAWLYSLTNQSKLAEYELKKLLDMSDESAVLCSALGHANWMQGRLEDGLMWYEKALSKEPNNPAALNGYGYLLACSGKKLTMALACCKKALEQKPDNPAYADSLGWTLFKLGKINEAGRYICASAARLPDNSEAQEHLAAYKEAVLLP